MVNVYATQDYLIPNKEQKGVLNAILLVQHVQDLKNLNAIHNFVEEIEYGVIFKIHASVQ